MASASTISGYAAIFGRETVIAGEFREKLDRGCFARTLREKPDVLAILNHDYDRLLGRTSSGTLSLQEDNIGLYFNLEPNPDTPDGMTAIGNVGRQDIRGASFGFRVRAERWEDGGNRLPLRIIEDVDLYEITLTPIPAYKDTTAVLREHNAAAAARRVREKAERAMRMRGIALT